MLNIVVLVSGGGTNLQALIDAAGTAGKSERADCPGDFFCSGRRMRWSGPRGTAFPAR